MKTKLILVAIITAALTGCAGMTAEQEANWKVGGNSE